MGIDTSNEMTENECLYCNAYNHPTNKHRCKICGDKGSHGSYDCPFPKYNKLYEEYIENKNDIIKEQFSKIPSNSVRIEYESIDDIVFIEPDKILNEAIKITINNTYEIYVYECYKLTKNYFRFIALSLLSVR